MTKADIIERISSGTGLTKLETEAVVNGFISIVKESLLDGERVDLRGFGSFGVQHRAARTARNPRTNVNPVRKVAVSRGRRTARQGGSSRSRRRKLLVVNTILFIWSEVS